MLRNLVLYLDVITYNKEHSYQKSKEEFLNG